MLFLNHKIPKLDKALLLKYYANTKALSLFLGGGDLFNVLNPIPLIKIVTVKTLTVSQQKELNKSCIYIMCFVLTIVGSWPLPNILYILLHLWHNYLVTLTNIRQCTYSHLPSLLSRIQFLWWRWFWQSIISPGCHYFYFYLLPGLLSQVPKCLETSSLLTHEQQMWVRYLFLMPFLFPSHPSFMRTRTIFKHLCPWQQFFLWEFLNEQP